MQHLLRRWRLLSLVLVLGMGPTTSACAGDSPTDAKSCCKVCKTGKACGDTCIDKSATCRVGQGCACNG